MHRQIAGRGWLNNRQAQGGRRHLADLEEYSRGSRGRGCAGAVCE